MMPCIPNDLLRSARSGTRRNFLTAGASGLLCWLVSSGALAAAAETIASLAGNYRHSGGKRDQRARDKAIDDVVSEMNFFVRGIARSRLKKATPIHKRVAIRRQDNQLTVTLDGRSYSAPSDGRPVRTPGQDGNEVELRYVVSGSRLEQWFVGDEGGRVNTFSRRGNDLVMQVRIYSPQLPKDLRYSLTYAKS